MSYLDHLFVLLFALLYPVAGFIGFQRLLRKMAAGHPFERTRLYRNTLLGQCALGAILVLIWSGAGRSPALLGLDLQADRRLLLGMLLTAAAIGLLLAQLSRVVNAGQATIDKLGGRLGRLAPLVPHNGRELALFNLVAISAGVVEELLWRGFLIWYLAQVLPMWAAALISTIGFGVAHAYQGAGNLLRITLVGAAFVGLYLLTGSIWLSMLLHAAIDLLQGRLACEIARRSSVPLHALSS